MHNFSGWADDLRVEVAGHAGVAHTGSVAVRLLADRTGLTGGRTPVMNPKDALVVHDRDLLINRITTLNTAPSRKIHYSVGFDLDERARTAITLVLADGGRNSRRRLGQRGWPGLAGCRQVGLYRVPRRRRWATIQRVSLGTSRVAR